MISKKLQSFDAVIIFFIYFVPIFSWSYFSLSLMSPSVSWISLSTGMIIASLGSIILYLLFKIPEEPVELRPLPEIQTTDKNPPSKDFSIELSNLQKENRDLLLKIEALESELIHKTTLSKDIEDEKNEGLSKLQDQIEALKKEISDKEHTIQELASRNNELDYEIRTLIDLSRDEDGEVESGGENEALELASLIKNKLENAPSNTSLERLIQSDRPTFIFALNPQDMRIIAFKGSFDIKEAEDLYPLLPLKALSWHEAILQIEKGKIAPVVLENGLGVLLTPITKGPFKDVILGVGI